ncbi:MAG: hypothetical protein ACLRM9_03685 [Collinsella aerofaciens]
MSAIPACSRPRRPGDTDATQGAASAHARARSGSSADRGVHEVPDGRLGVLGPARAGALEVALQVRHAALPAALEQA